MVVNKNLLYLTTSKSLPERPIVQSIGLQSFRAYSYRRLSFMAPKHDCVVGWGRKRTGTEALALSKKYSSKLLLLEDGFIRSFDREDCALSIVMDDLGIYYDAHERSRLEEWIKIPLSEDEIHSAAEIIKAWKENNISKYNSAPIYDKSLPDDYVLVIDQVYGDASIKFGLADTSNFSTMLDKALAENPDSTVVVKVHPDAYTKSKSGHFDVRHIASMDRVLVIAENCHLPDILKGSKKVYTVTSQVGFEGLMWGKEVRCFGMPFYAGWGLTNDELACSRRTTASLEGLVYSALVRYPIYLDESTGTLSNVFNVIDNISRKRLRAFSD